MLEIYSLAVLESLIQFNGRMSLDQLWKISLAKFKGSEDAVCVLGNTAEAFECFLNRQSALFHVLNGYVYSSDERSIAGDCNNISTHISQLLPLERSRHTLMSNNALQKGIHDDVLGNGWNEAINYFEDHLLRKPEKWIPIKNLAGHLSQASPSIRMMVGSQAEFSNFLRQYPQFFKLQGELVGLANCQRSQQRHDQKSVRRKKCRLPSLENCTQSDLQNQSLSVPLEVEMGIPNQVNNPEIIPGGCDTVVISVDDCKAVLWLVWFIDTSGNNAIDLCSLLWSLSRAPKSVQSFIGTTQIELLEFIKKFPQMLLYDDHTRAIRILSLGEIHLLVISRGQPNRNSDVMLSQSGRVFCVNKLWGIIDLGSHEHVFFDRSLFKHVTDLSKHFKVEEIVFFNAILAPKASRAKWRATRAWKETDQITNLMLQLTTNAASTNGLMSNEDPDSGLGTPGADTSLEQPTLELLLDDISEAVDHCKNKFATICLLEVGTADKAFTPIDDSNEILELVSEPIDPSFEIKYNDCSLNSGTDSPVSELSTMSGVPSISGYVDGDIFDQSYSDPMNTNSLCLCPCSHCMNCRKSKVKKSRSVFTQTLSTGEIMSTKLCHEDSLTKLTI